MFLNIKSEQKGKYNSRPSNKSGAGFTIIELIVVIAIIAVLAVIVISAIIVYVGRAKNTAIKANMDTILKNSISYIEEHGDFSGAGYFFCDDSLVQNARLAIKNAGGFPNIDDYVPCHAASDSWCVCSGLLAGSNDTFCVDSTGYKKELEGAACDARCKNAGARQCDAS